MKNILIVGDKGCGMNCELEFILEKYIKEKNKIIHLNDYKGELWN